MLEKNAYENCCFLCSVIFIEYYSTMHCNEVLQACQVNPIYCDIFGAAERVLRYGLPINLRYIFKRVPALYGTPSLKEGIPAMKKRILETLIFLQDSPRLSGINNF